jgi:hypothetical protein
MGARGALASGGAAAAGAQAQLKQKGKQQGWQHQQQDEAGRLGSLAAPVGWAGVKAAFRQAESAGLSAGVCRCFGGWQLLAGSDN